MEDVLSRLDPDIIGACLILGVIGSVGIIITTVVAITDTYKSITMAKISKAMVEDLLARGYSPEEIERLLHGDKAWNKFKRFFAKQQSRGREGYRPMPPVKQHV